MKILFYIFVFSTSLILQSCDKEDSEMKMESAPNYAQQAHELAQKYGMRFEIDNPDSVTSATLCELDSVLKILNRPSEDSLVNRVTTVSEDSFVVIMNTFFPAFSEKSKK